MTRRSQPITHGRHTRFDLAIELCWLIALAMVPLAFSGPDVVVLFAQPKDFILHFAALSIVALWAFEWALSGYRPQADLNSRPSVRQWLGTNPRNWALTAAGGFGVAAILSTILSPIPIVSLWGRNFAQLGYELYSILSFEVIFFAIAVRVRNENQIRRILWVIAAAGTLAGLYGISQRYGWDPIGNGEDQARVVSSFGNPIFFGSFLLMSVVVTMGLALDPARRSDRWWLPVIGVAIGVQLAALWFTGSRGPWLGLVFGLTAFAVIGAVTLTRANAIRAAVLLAAGLLFAAAIVNLAGDPGEGSSRGIASVVSGVNPAVGGLSGRTDIWRGGIRLIDSWETQETESGAVSALRPVFGLGPEMYYYSFPLSADPQNGVVAASHAHNFPLQVLLELGVAGLVTFMALAVAVLVTGLGFIWSRGRTDDLLSIAMLAVVAGLVGRAAEQMVGIARVGDLVPFWGLLAVVLAMVAVSPRVRDTPRCATRVDRTGRSYLRLGAAAAVVAVALVVFVTRDVQMMRAGLIASDAFDKSAAGDRAEAIRLLERASDISPAVQQYGVWRGRLLVEESRAQADADSARGLLGDAFSTFLKYEDRDRFAFTTQLSIGLAEAELVNLGDSELRNDLIARSLRLADAMAAYPAIQAIAAERVLIAGQLELGLELADRAIAMEAATIPQPFAWFMRGNALGDLGDVEGALDAFNTALDREPEGKIAPAVHRNIALVYDGLGDAGLAAEHRALADEKQNALSDEEPGK